MVPQTKKVDIYPTETTPDKFPFLSPGMDDNYILSSTTASVTPD